MLKIQEQRQICQIKNNFFTINQKPKHLQLLYDEFNKHFDS